jgi:ketosteroid isomerase-like protein
MKKTSMCCAIGLVLLANCAWAQEKSAGGTEKAVTALEHQWLESQKTNNVELFIPLLADKFVNTGGDGKVTNAKEAIAEAKGTKWTSVEYDDLKVTVFDSTAIATGEFKGKGTDSKGKALDEDERFTDTWVKMPSGKWQCVASEDTPIKM